MKNKFIFVVLITLLSFSVIQAQYPSGAGVSLTTSFFVNSGSLVLTNGTSYDLFLLDAAGTTVIGSQYTFVYNSGAGNTITLANLGSPVLTANTSYKWGVWPNGTASPPNPATVISGIYSFTTNSASPSLSSPTDGQTGLSTLGTTLNWGSSAGADHYRITIQVQSTHVTIGGAYPKVVTSATLSDVLPTLALGTTYEWKVDASNDGGLSWSTSSFITFTTSLTNISPVLAGIEVGAFSYTEGPALPVTSSITITDPDDVNLASATIQITTNYQNGYDYLSYTDVAPLSGSWNAATGTLTITGAGTVAQYQTALRSVNFFSPGNTSKVVSFRVNDSHTNSNIVTRTVNVTPFLVQYVNGLTGVSIEPSFSWNSRPSVTSYEIRISTQGSSQVAFDANVIATQTGISSLLTSFAFNATMTGMPLNNNTTYYWQMIARDAPDYTSVIRHFTTYPAVTVTMYNPEDGGTNWNNTSVLFSYGTGLNTNGLEFKIQFYQLDAGTPSEAQWATTTTPGTASAGYIITNNLSYNKTGLLAGKRYCWRVIVQNSTTHEVYRYSAVRSFTNKGGASVVLTQSYPIGGTQVFTSTPEAYWYIDHSATGLTYQLAYRTTAPGLGDVNIFDDVAGVTLVPGTPTITNLHYTFPALPSGSQIWWQVRAYYADATTYSYSAIETFNTPAAVVVAPITPFLSYPITGMLLYTTAPDLYWYLGQDPGVGLRYQVALKDNVAPVGGDLFDGQATKIPAADTYAGLITSLSYSLSSLTPGHTYYWQVRSSYDGVTWSTPSAIESFVLIGATSDRKTVATDPLGNATVYSNRPTLSWYLEGSTLGVGGFTVKYSTTDQSPNWSSYAGAPSASGGVYTVSSSTFSKALDVDLTSGQHYYWAVVVSGDASSESAYSTGDFTVVGGASSIQLTFPADGDPVYTSSTLLSWFVVGSTSGIHHYSIMYSNSDVFAGSAPITQTTTSLTTNKTLTGLNQGTSYYWKVRAWADAGETIAATPWSSVFRFDVNSGAGKIVQPLAGGPNNVTLSTTSPVLTWVLPSKTAANSSYEVQIADNSGFTNAKSVTSNNPSIKLSGLEPTKNYYWRVRAKDATGNPSYYSNTAKFGVSAVTGIANESIPTTYQLEQNYPNPFNPTTVINYSLPSNSQVTLKVFDMLGREVRTLVNTNMVAGKYSVEWNGDDNFGRKVSTGIYLYRISANNFTSVKKMILIK